MQRLCGEQPALAHHYADLSIQLFLQLADSHLRSATAGAAGSSFPAGIAGLRSDLRSEEVALHMEKALDCLHTADERIDAEAKALAATSPTHSLLSRLEKYAALQRTLRGKIDGALRSLVLFNVPVGGGFHPGREAEVGHALPRSEHAAAACCAAECAEFAAGCRVFCRQNHRRFLSVRRHAPRFPRARRSRRLFIPRRTFPAIHQRRIPRGFRV